MRVILLFLFLILPSLANAQEVVSAFDKAGLVTFNEEMRQSSASIRSIKAQVADILPLDLSVATNIEGVLPIANGGTGSSTSIGVPQGAIIMWSGTIATIPTGYELADGSCSITCPDLRNRFIVGADADVSSVAKSTVTGSALQTSNGQIPSHTHTYGIGYTGGGDAVSSYSEMGAGNERAVTDSYGTGTKNIAVFYALAFIIKT